MIKIFLAVLITIFSSLLSADDGAKVLAGFDPRVDLIAENYEAGPFLIYDCVEDHWVCVTGPYYLECGEKRKLNIKEGNVRASCSPIGEFPTKKSCFQRQLFMTSNNHGFKFCVLPEWKEKEIIIDHQK